VWIRVRTTFIRAIGIPYSISVIDGDSQSDTYEPSTSLQPFVLLLENNDDEWREDDLLLSSGETMDVYRFQAPVGTVQISVQLQYNRPGLNFRLMKGLNIVNGTVSVSTNTPVSTLTTFGEFIDVYIQRDNSVSTVPFVYSLHVDTVVKGASQGEFHLFPGYLPKIAGGRPMTPCEGTTCGVSSTLRPSLCFLVLRWWW